MLLQLQQLYPAGSLGFLKERFSLDITKVNNNDEGLFNCQLEKVT